MRVEDLHYHGWYTCAFCGRLAAESFGGRHVCQDCREGFEACSQELGSAEFDEVADHLGVEVNEATQSPPAPRVREIA